MRFLSRNFVALLLTIVFTTSIFAEVTKQQLMTGTKKADQVYYYERPTERGKLPPVGARNPRTLDEVIVSEGFEAYLLGEQPVGWTVVDVDGGNNPAPFGGPSVWQVLGGTGWSSHQGDRFVCCAYNSNGLPPNDDWLIIPVGNLPAPITFGYWCASQEDPYLENYSLLVSTTGTNPADFTNSITSETDVPVDWQQRSFDLSSYAGAPFYIAFHYTSTDEFVFKVDDIMLEAAGGALPTGTIAGNVTLAGSTTPIQDVMVSALGSGLSVMTDAAGAYTLDGVPVGSYTVRFMKVGYALHDVANVAVTEGQTTTQDAALVELDIIQNDDCDSPFVLGSTTGDFEFSTELATLDNDTPELPDSCANSSNLAFAPDIWIAWTAPAAGEAVFSLCNSANYDTRLACYSTETADCPPCPLDNNDLVACNDDAASGDCGLTSLMQLDVVANACYLVRVGGWNGDVGSGTLSVSFTPTDAADDNSALAKDYYFARSYPNPFNPSTTISFSIPKAEHVSVKVYNSVGQQVAELADARLDAGTHDFNFNAANLPSGLYFAYIQTEGFSQTLKTVLLK